jgi:hypothetical protein
MTVAIAAHLIIAIALIVLAIQRASIVMPVSLTLPARPPLVFAVVDLAAAAALIVLVSAIARSAAAVLASRGAPVARLRAIRYLEWSQLAGITLFLVAQLNGITEVGTLVLCYAVGAACIGVLWVQGRGSAEHRAAAWPFSLGAALAIVPWGVIALYQVGALVASSPPAPLVRVMTIVILLVSAAAWWAERRWHLSALTDARADALHTLLSAANGLALLVVTVGLARPSALF